MFVACSIMAVSLRKSSNLLIVEGGGLTAISTTTAEAMRNAGLLIVHLQRCLSCCTTKIIHWHQQKPVTTLDCIWQKIEGVT